MTVRSIEQVLRLLRDEQWHSISDVAEKTRLSVLKMQIITEFLAKYHFIRFNRKDEKIKVSHSVARFFQ